MSVAFRPTQLPPCCCNIDSPRCGARELMAVEDATIGPAAKPVTNDTSMSTRSPTTPQGAVPPRRSCRAVCASPQHAAAAARRLCQRFFDGAACLAKAWCAGVITTSVDVVDAAVVSTCSDVMPKRRSRELNSSIATSNASSPKSGHNSGITTSSAYATCHNKKFERRISPEVRISRSGSGTSGCGM